ncbi:MAG: M48 family metallopeptidase [Pseudomonadota bacterium]
MVLPSTWSGTYFDGQSAVSQSVDVVIADKGLQFTDERGSDHLWLYRRIHIEQLPDQCRLTYRGARDAGLLLPNEAVDDITSTAPFLLERNRRRRQFFAMVAGLTFVAGTFAFLVFGAMPAAATWLARSTPVELEEQIGANLAGQLQLLFRPCNKDEADALIAPVVEQYADAAGIAIDVEMTLVRTDLPNAFALPGGQMMATQGLLHTLEDDQEAFWAVVAHELAHVKHRDGMVAVYRNLGISTLLEILTGGSGLAQQAILLGGQLNDLNYTRGQEQRADEAAYELLASQSLNPAALGRALAAISADMDDDDDRAFDAEWPEWFQTHPNTEKRIDAARRFAEPMDAVLPLDDEEWAVVVSACDSVPTDDEPVIAP